MSAGADLPPEPGGMVVSPEPTDAELAAIVAAYDAVWPKPVDAKPAEPVSTTWRFGGRWFNRSFR